MLYFMHFGLEKYKLKPRIELETLRWDARIWPMRPHGTYKSHMLNLLPIDSLRLHVANNETIYKVFKFFILFQKFVNIKFYK